MQNTLMANSKAYRKGLIMFSIFNNIIQAQNRTSSVEVFYGSILDASESLQCDQMGGCNPDKCKLCVILLTGGSR